MKDNHNGPDENLNRRDFLHKMAVGSVIGAGVMAFAGIIQLPLPKVFNEPPRQFKIGFPTDFPFNTYKLIKDKNVLILRDESGIRALSAICTHLGCVVTLTSRGFQCPCHGSKFDIDGKVLSGPAPKALEWLKVGMSPDGQLTVDLNEKVNINQTFVV